MFAVFRFICIFTSVITTKANNMISFEKYLELKKVYNEKLEDLSDKVNSFEKLADGRIADRKNPEFIQSKKQYDAFFKIYQNFNKTIPASYSRKAYQMKLKKQL